MSQKFIWNWKNKSEPESLINKNYDGEKIFEIKIIKRDNTLSLRIIRIWIIVHPKNQKISVIKMFQDFVTRNASKKYLEEIMEEIYK